MMLDTGPTPIHLSIFFETDHEEMARTIITSEDTQINAVLKQVAPDFPKSC